MIYINRMYETTRSHSALTNRYVEEAIKDMDDVVLYPDKVVDDTDIFLHKEDMEMVLAEYGIKSMEFLMYEELKPTDELIFLDSRQLIYEQFHITNIDTIPKVFIRFVDYGSVSHRLSNFYHSLDNTFLPLVHTNYTSEFYKYKRYEIVGGFADEFKPAKNKKDIAIWSSRKVKGYKDALIVSKDVPTKLIPLESSNLTSEELFKEFDGAKVVMSFDTWIETFGNTIMQAISRGCIPLLPNKACYPFIYPKEFLYGTIDECINKANLYINNYELYWERYKNVLEEIVDYYQPQHTVKRMLNKLDV